MALKCNSNDKLTKDMKSVIEFAKDKNIKIGGCGCCGSPWLVDEEGNYYNDVNELF